MWLVCTEGSNLIVILVRGGGGGGGGVGLPLSPSS